MKISRMSKLLILSASIFLTGCMEAPTELIEKENIPTVIPSPPIPATEENHFAFLVSDMSADFIEGVKNVIAEGNFSSQMEQYFGDVQQQESQSEYQDEYYGEYQDEYQSTHQQTSCDDSVIGEKEVSQIKDDLRSIIHLLLSNKRPGQVDGQFDFTPNPNVCDQYLARCNPSSCREAMEQITITSEALAYHSGVISLKYGTHSPFTIRYGETDFDLTVELEELRNTIQEIVTLDEGTIDDIPTMQGVLKLAASRLAIDHLRVNIDLLENLEISHTEEGQDPYDSNDDKVFMLNTPATDNLISFNIDTLAKTAEISLDMLDFLLTFTTVDRLWDGYQEVEELTEVNVTISNGIAGQISLHDNLKHVNISNLQLKNQSLEVVIQEKKEDVLPKIYELHNEYDLNLLLDASGEKFRITNNEMIMASLNLREGWNDLAENRLSLFTDSNVSLELEKVPYQNSSKVLFKFLNHDLSRHNILSLDGVGQFEGILDLSHEECFTTINAENTSFPFELVPYCQL